MTNPEAPASSRTYPVFLRLEGRPVLVVGAGPVGAEKTKKLVAAGARVRVVAPEASEAFSLLGLPLERRPFDESCLDGVFFVLAAAPPEVNKQVYDACERRGLFVLAVDCPAHASAFGGAIVERGDVTMLIGTEGRAPALAGLLREALDELLPRDLGAWVDVASALRPKLAELGLSFSERRRAVLETLVRLYSPGPSAEPRPSIDGCEAPEPSEIRAPARLAQERDVMVAS